MHRPRRFVPLVVGVLLTVGLLTGCGDSPAGKPLPPASSASPTPTPAHEAWKADASEDEIALFEDATLWLQSYEDGSFRYFQQGKATQEAKEFFQDHSARWSSTWKTLKQREADGVKTISTGTVLWRKPTYFALGKEPSITIFSCVDLSTVKYQGAKLKAPDHPVVFNTQMSRMKDRGWTIFVDEIPSKGDIECEE